MRALALMVALWAGQATAHEFWIDGEEWQVAPGEPLVAQLRVGDKLKGAAYSYVPPNFRRFELIQNGETVAVTGRAGDRPALNMAAPADGLVTVVHYTKDYTLKYDSWEKFVTFCTHKDFEWALDAHLERGFTKDAVWERYSRHAKSLFAVGDGVGRDIRAGLEVEIVALANPYSDDMSDGLPVQVFYQDEPQVDVQVELFEKTPEGEITITTTRTDEEGRAMLRVAPGNMYLVDHVVMRPLEPEADSDPVWESLWASLTFAVPE